MTPTLAMIGGLGIVLMLLGLLALGVLARLNKNFVPGLQDEALRITESTTNSSSGSFYSPWLDQGLDFKPGGVGMPVVGVTNVTAADGASGDEAYTFVLQESDDKQTITDCGPAVTVDVDTTNSKTGAISVPGFMSSRYVRLKLTVAGTTPSITWEAWLNCNGCC